VVERKKQQTSAPTAPARDSASAVGVGQFVRRVQSRELFGRNDQIIIEHSGREYRLRVTSNGKLILTA
jgi:hemin uptake protein HemP